MKIVFFLFKFPVVSETFILNQIAFFIKNGIDVEIVSVFPGEKDIQHNIISEYDLMSKTRFLLDSEPNGKFKKLFSRIKGVADCLASGNGIKCANFRHYGYFSKTLLLPQIISKKNERSIVADVIISHFGTTAALLNQLKRLGFANGKTAAIFHGNDISHKRILSSFEKDYIQLFDDADYIFPISDLWASKIITNENIRNKTYVVRMGVDVDKFTYTEPTRFNTPLRLLTTARLMEKKGIDVAIRACAELKSKGVEFVYNIIGNGPLKEQLQRLVVKYDLTSNVVFHGVQSQETITSFLNSADLFLLPSMTAVDGDMEGIPVALMEAMAVGTPVVSTYHSGIPELIEHNVSGFLVGENDFLALADIIMDIRKRPFNEIIQVAKNARVKIELTFNRDASYREMLKYIQ